MIKMRIKILPEIEILREFEWVNAQNDSNFLGTNSTCCGRLYSLFFSLFVFKANKINSKHTYQKLRRSSTSSEYNKKWISHWEVNGRRHLWNYAQKQLMRDGKLRKYADSKSILGTSSLRAFWWIISDDADFMFELHLLVGLMSHSH